MSIYKLGVFVTYWKKFGGFNIFSLGKVEREVNILKNRSEKELKTNSYEADVKTKGTKHLKGAPKPHGYGGRVTENDE